VAATSSESVQKADFGFYSCAYNPVAANNAITSSAAPPPAGESIPNRSVDFIGIPNSDETDLSPLGMDLGEFLTEDNLDFLTGLIGTSQPIFDMPIQGY
jgi:hypothetical protein